MVSIVLPNLNTPLDFLKERVESIINQSYTNWNCIIIDGFSTNGSKEYLEQLCLKDLRFQFHQRPKKGIYNAWNEGIKLVTNQYIYIATSDDTMLPELLKTMVKELDINLDCGLAHCGLTIIDEKSDSVDDNRWENYWTSQYFGVLNNHKHKRLAPHDGILHMAVQTVYTSITQLLIRKELFDEIGLFRIDNGPIADFEWGMRASLITNTIHVPEKLATWRMHNQQATSNNYNDTAEHRNNLCKLAKMALEQFKNKNPQVYHKFNYKKLFFVYRRDQFNYELNTIQNNLKKISLLLYWTLFCLPVIIDFFLAKLRIVSKHFDRIKFIKNYMQKNGLEKNIIILS